MSMKKNEKEEIKVTEEKKEEVKSDTKNKGILFIVLGVALIIVFIVVICFIVKKNGQENVLSKSLESMGKDFYENFYYEQVGSTNEERANFLSKYESIGIKINLDNLSRYDNNKNADKLNEFVNKKTNKSCDKVNTKVTIYPKKPYNKTSYKIETQLDCGFSDKK